MSWVDAEGRCSNCYADLSGPIGEVVEGEPKRSRAPAEDAASPTSNVENLPAERINLLSTIDEKLHILEQHSDPIVRQMASAAHKTLHAFAALTSEDVQVQVPYPTSG